MFIQVYFLEAQTGPKFQFYRADGALIGGPVTAGVVALPQAGAYGAETEVPSGSVGVVWTSDDPEVEASEDLREALKAAGSGATPDEIADEVESRADQILFAELYVPTGLPEKVVPDAPDEDDLATVYFYTSNFSGVESRGVTVTFTLAGPAKAGKALSLLPQTLVSGADGFDSVNLKRTDMMTPAGSVYLVNSLELGFRDVEMTLTDEVFDLSDLITD